MISAEEERYQPMVESYLDGIWAIVIRYNNEEYVRICDRDSDKFHTGIYVRELLKSGWSESNLEDISNKWENELSDNAIQFLDEVIKEGMEEYKLTLDSIFPPENNYNK